MGNKTILYLATSTKLYPRGFISENLCLLFWLIQTANSNNILHGFYAKMHHLMNLS